MARTLDVRAGKVKYLIEHGANAKEAMLKAGYSNNYAVQPNRVKAMGELVQQSRNKYLSEFIKAADKESMNGEYIVNRLKQTIDAKDNFNSTQAIKVFNSVMINNQDKSMQITMNGVFVVPNLCTNDEWENKIKKFTNVVDINPQSVKDDTKR